MSARPRAAIAAAAAACALLAGCAVPQIDRYLLQQDRAPVRLEGVRGPLSRAQSESILAELRRKSPETGIFDRHVAVEEAVAGNPLSVGNRVTLLADGAETYASMLEAIASARHHIHFETYTFEADEVGRKFADALLERHRAGVQVRLIYDSVGSIGTPRHFFQRMADAGIEVVEFNPVTPATVLSRGILLNRRNHRKLTVIDGRVAFLGGINISGVYTPGGVVAGQRGGVSGSLGDDGRPFEQQPWRDTQVRIEGPVVADFQKSFLAMWAQMLKEAPLADAAFYPPLPRVGPHVVRAVEGWTAKGLNPIYVTLLSAIESAESTVHITMAYFVPHEELMAALKSAAARGVQVKLLLPSRTDHWMVFHAGRSFYDELLSAGVQIHERKQRLLHAKTATVDGVWSTVGSTNLDWRSLLHNDEINAVVLGADFTGRLDRMFQDDLRESQRIHLGEWRQRGVKDRAREAAARLWGYLL